MNHSVRQQDHHSLTTQLVCAVAFCVFCFSWLFWFQADVIAVAQHVLSRGVTHYDRTLGAVLVTAVLLLLQRGVAVIVRLWRRTHALSYLPSMLLLAFISDAGSSIESGSSFWYWMIPVALLLWAAAVWLAQKVLPFGTIEESVGIFSRRVWTNMLLMLLMMLGVASLSNTNAVYHFRAHAEVKLAEGDAEGALMAGRESHESDESLTLLRMYALSKRGQLGDRLFSYPVSGTSADILPTADSHGELLLLSADSIWRHLGGRPAPGMGVKVYLRALVSDSLATSPALDYVLCADLIDRDVDAFVAHLDSFCELTDTVADALPRHYREALTLYTHLRTRPVTVYHHAVMDEDWDNFQELERSYPDYSECRQAVADRYGESYWYYYFYSDKNGRKTP